MEYSRWLSSPVVDSDTKLLIEKMDDATKQNAFSGFMTFGTAGLRAKMMPGTSMMNTYTVAHATAGLARLILSLGEEAVSRGVVIAFDSRNNSAAFARRSAEVLSSYGIRTYIYNELRPTPCLSFAVRYLNCIAGINITASHNPAEYNGYKAYWEDGAQISPEQADIISAEIAKTDILDDVPIPDKADKSLILTVPSEVDDAYKKCVLNERVNPDAIPAVADDFRIVYTPLHGAGITMVPDVLKEAGLKYLYTVEEQSEPNGDFPTLHFPNPEFPEAFELGKILAEKEGSDLIVATDPDSDRVGIMARDKNGKFRCISGNQMGALLLDYVITAHKEKNSMPPEPYAIKSIVSTALAEKICTENGVKMYDVLTGFKYIGEVIKNHISEGHGTYLLGFEESYGYLKGTYARDKDAVVASMLICEMAAYYFAKNMTICDALTGLFQKYGYYLEKTENFYFDTPDGKEKMKAVMEKLRENPLTSVAGRKVKIVRDYKSGISKNLETGDETPTALPSSDILYYVCDGCITVVRPSGTEPKLKLYFLANGTSESEALKEIKDCSEFMKGVLGI